MEAIEERIFLFGFGNEYRQTLVIVDFISFIHRHIFYLGAQMIVQHSKCSLNALSLFLSLFLRALCVHKCNLYLRQCVCYLHIHIYIFHLRLNVSGGYTTELNGRRDCVRKTMR